MDAVARVCGEIPLPVCVTSADVAFGVRAVVVHGPQEWVEGRLCRSCRGVSYPCRIHMWGRRVLAVWGLSQVEIDAVVVRGDPDVVVAGPRRGW